MVAEYDAKFGLDKPLWRQYLTYLGDMARFDLGPSIASYPRTAKDIIGDGIFWTLGLLSVSTVLAFLVGTTFGALQAWPKAPGWLQYLAPPLMTFAAIPAYLLGLLLMFVFAYGLKVLPGYGGYQMGTIPTRTWGFALDVVKHSILPGLAIVLTTVGSWALGMRGMMVTVEGEDYMSMAEAKGLPNHVLFVQYGVRNAMLPQVTALALSFGYLFSGSTLVEVVFGYPGLGNILVNSIRGVDYPVMQGIIFTIILSLAIATLIVDLGLPLLDPRIGYGRKS